MSRNRLYINGTLEDDEVDMIINPRFRWHGELAQFTARITPAPTVSEYLTVSKTNVSYPDQDVLLRRFDLEDITDLCCNDVFQFRLGDVLEVSYPNSDGVKIGFQAVLREAD